MMHLDEGRLQAYLDSELQLDDRRRVDRHLAACDACREALSGLRSLSSHFAGAVARLDYAPRSRQHAIGWPRTRALRDARRVLPRAAALLLFTGAAASAAIPGSPMRGWLSELAEPAPPSIEAAATHEPEAVTPTAADTPVEAGVSVETADGAVRIVLREAGEDVSVRASFVAGSRAGVYAADAGDSIRFQTGAGRIEVVNAQGALRIELPLDAATATVVVNGREVLKKQDGRLDVPLRSAGGAGEVDFSVEP